MTHTPTPWTINGPSPGLDRDIDDGGDYAILSAEKHIIAETFRLISRGIAADSEANAQFIVRAVNNHDALLEALEGLADKVSDYSLERASGTDVADAIGQARAAVARVTEES